MSLFGWWGSQPKKLSNKEQRIKERLPPEAFEQYKKHQKKVGKGSINSYKDKNNESEFLSQCRIITNKLKANWIIRPKEHLGLSISKKNCKYGKHTTDFVE